MGKKKITWTRKSEIQMFAIMDYYANRNKNNNYSLTLLKSINSKLSNLDFTVTLPKKASVNGIFYFTHNHISVFFTIDDNNIFVVLIWDERRNPKDLIENLNNE